MNHVIFDPGNLVIRELGVTFRLFASTLADIVTYQGKPRWQEQPGVQGAMRTGPTNGLNC